MKGLGVVGFLVVIVILMCIAPLLTLASLNTIFEQAGIQAYIPHNGWTYLSVWGLALVFGGSSAVRNR